MRLGVSPKHSTLITTPRDHFLKARSLLSASMMNPVDGGNGGLVDFHFDVGSMDFLSSSMMMQPVYPAPFLVPTGPTLAPAPLNPASPSKRKQSVRKGATPNKKRRGNKSVENGSGSGEKNEAQLTKHRKIEQRRRSKVAALQAELRVCVLRSDPSIPPETVTTKAEILKAAINHFSKRL